jgi:outer membrane lipoprotein-sorting protein
MKMVKTCFALVIALTAFTQIRAQTADEIINKYFDAIGGRDKIAQIKSVRMENTIEAMGGEGPSTITILNGKGYRIDSEVNGNKITQVYTDKGGWAINPFMGSTTPQAVPEDVYKQNKDRLDVGGPLFNYAAKGSKVVLDGGEAGAYKLKVTTADSTEMELYIDSATYNLVKLTSSASMMGQTMEITTTFSDFKKSDFGVVYPYTTEISFGGQFDITSKVKKLDINPEVDPAIFEMPKS